MIPIGFHLFLSKWIFVWFLSTLLGLIDWDRHILRKAGIITSYDPSECWTECITRRIIWATKVHGFLQMRWKIVEKFCGSVWKELKKTGKRKKKTLGFFLALPIYQKNMGPRVMVVHHCKLSAPNWLESEVDRVRTFPAIIENLKPHCEKSCHVFSRCFAWHVWIVQCKNSGLGIVVQMQWNGHIVLAKYKEEQTFSFSFRSMITMNRWCE